MRAVANDDLTVKAPQALTGPFQARITFRCCRCPPHLVQLALDLMQLSLAPCLGGGRGQDVDLSILSQRSYLSWHPSANCSLL